MKFIFMAIAIGLFCYACWRVFGKDLAAYLADSAEDDIKEITEDDIEPEIIEMKSLRQTELEDKISELKKKADDLRMSTEELKVTQMLEEVMKQLAEKEDELRNLDTNIWINQK
jgi:TolA-binding protein